jgi:hypothetical protein
MSDLEPEFTVKVEFPFKELFDPTDPLAQWVANLSRAVNDLLLANRRLAEGFEREESSHEAIYDIRAVASHAWELAEFLRKTNSTAVDTFLARMIEEARGEYDKALAALQAPEPGDSPEQKSFKATLASARDQASHYSEIDHKLLRRAIEGMCEDNKDGTPHIGTAYIGRTFKDSYNQFASELDYRLFCEIKGEDMEPLKKFIMPLNELVASLIKFASTAIHTYLYDYEDKLEIEHLDSTQDS